MGTTRKNMDQTKIDGLTAIAERLKDDLAREKDSNAAYNRTLKSYREENQRLESEVTRLANELAAAKTRVGRLERVIRGLRDAFIAATEEDAAPRPFSLPTR